MTGPAVGLLIALVVGCVLAPSLVIGFVRRRTRAGGMLVDELLGDGVLRLDERARCLGIASLPDPPIAGPGALALSAEVLLFVQPLPRSEMWVGRDRIEEVDVRSSHLGRAPGGPLLWVRWRTGDGGSDAAAFAVDDVEAWVAALSR